MNWQKLSISKGVVNPTVGGLISRRLTDKNGILTYYQITFGAPLNGLGDGCWLVIPVSGICESKNGCITVGDLWLGNGTDLEINVEEGKAAEIFALRLNGIDAPEESRALFGADNPFVAYPDPNNRPTQPVQVLLEGQISVLRTRFSPDFCAAEHWHDFDTWYFILSGSMRFGQEGVYNAKEVRQVEGGFSYGPEDPGPDGVDFILVSVGGPVALHWSDLEPPPKGSLKVV